MRVPVIKTITSQVHKASKVAQKPTRKQIEREKALMLELAKARAEKMNCIHVIPETNILGLPLYM